MTFLRTTVLCIACCLSASLITGVDAQEEKKLAAAIPAKDIRHTLLGAWAFAGKPDSTNDPKPGATTKFWGLKHFTVVSADRETGDVSFCHGGTYTVDGDSYAETVEFAKERKFLIGKTFKFKIKVDGDAYIQNGIGNTFNERWVRLKPK